MELRNCKGQWALVTGASSGIGHEFCVQLARAGMNLVMVARRKERMEQLATELTSLHNIRVMVLAIDLSQLNAAIKIKAHVKRENVQIRLLCNNAGFWQWGRFEQTSPNVYQEMVQVNVASMVALCHQFLPDLTSFPTSAIINVSSPAALQPVPYIAVYAATKAFVHSFSQALYGEWKEQGVLVQTLVPGPTDTEFDKGTETCLSTLKERRSPEEVVKVSLAHLADDAPLVVTAKGAFKQRVFASLFPARLVIREVAKRFKPVLKL